MSDDHSDGEDPVDMTEDMEIELNLPQEVDGEQDRPREDIREPPGVIGPGETPLGQEERHRYEPRTGPVLNGPDTDCPSRVLWNLVVQGRELRRIWEVPEWIGEDWE